MPLATSDLAVQGNAPGAVTPEAMDDYIRCIGVKALSALRVKTIERPSESIRFQGDSRWYEGNRH